MLKNAIRIVNLRRAASERRLRELRACHELTQQHLDELKRHLERIEHDLVTTGPVPHSTLSARALSAMADEARQLRRDVEERTARQTILEQELAKIENSCRREARALRALHQKSAFLQKHEKRDSKRRGRRYAVEID